jgi:hypothetical protein
VWELFAFGAIQLSLPSLFLVGEGLDLSVPKATDEVIVDHADGLHR